MAMPTSFPNMSVPGALSPAGLGLGDLLGGRVREETEEQKRCVQQHLDDDQPFHAQRRHVFVHHARHVLRHHRSTADARARWFDVGERGCQCDRGRHQHLFQSAARSVPDQHQRRDRRFC
jgi:hypothetical protein